MTTELSHNPTFAGDLGTIDNLSRLYIPKAVRKTVDFLKNKPKKSLGLMAELVSPGHIRLHLRHDAQLRLDVLRERLIEEHPEPKEVLATLSDKYRLVTYYPDNRIVIPSAIDVFLRPEGPLDENLFLESKGLWIDVMTISVRNKRLATYGPELEIIAPPSSRATES